MSGVYTLLIAHPDDELLWMWPVLGNTRKIVCASSDKHNAQRSWCRERRLCLEEVGRQLGAEVVCLDANSEFYRMPTRGGELKAHAEQLMRHMDGPVFTHNAWGEYGHIDHVLCHQIALASGCEVWTTDICQEVNWFPLGKRPAGSYRCHMDKGQFNALRQIYDARGCWTWSHEPVTECGVVRIC